MPADTPGTHRERNGIRRPSMAAALWVALVAGGLSGAAGGAFWGISRDLPHIRALETYRPSASTRIVSVDGIQLAELFAERRTPVPLGRMPVMLRQAVLATEDRQFYNHSGVDLKAIARAIVRNLRAGEYVEGASTITQQLAKTLFLTPRKTLLRKVREALLAFQLERRYTKDEILAMYLNQVYFGSGAYGVEAAARLYFGAPVENLELAQCALLAGLPKAPSRYSPRVNPDLARQRRNIVLAQMRTTGMISPEAFEAARARPLALVDSARPDDRAPYFVAHVRSRLEELIGAERLYRAGLTVRTTLHMGLQQAARQAVSTGIAAIESRQIDTDPDRQPVEGALVCLDVAGGAIRVMVGGRDYRRSRFNRVTQARRQPGSAFKPLVVALALEEGFTQDRLILDAPMVFPGGSGGDWRPHNFSGDYLGDICLRRVLTASRNIPAVRLVDMLGPSAVVELARRLGIASELAPTLTLALGASEVTLLELTSAYTVFPNQGCHAPPHAIVEITDAQGRLLFQHGPRRRVALDRITAAVMVDMLQGVVQEGTGRAARDLSVPAGGKTGTTDDCRDALFVGFTPRLAAGVWLGRDDATPLGRSETGARAALPIWLQFMRAAAATHGSGRFDRPPGTVRIWMDPVTGRRAGPGQPGAVAALFPIGDLPASGVERKRSVEMDQ